MNRLRKLIAAALVIAALTAAGIVLAIVVSPDHDEIPNNVLSSDDTVIVDVSLSPTTALLSGIAIQPGDIITGTATVTNTDPLNTVTTSISVTHAAANALTAALVLNVSVGDCASGPFVNADGTAIGTPLFHGPYDTAGELATFSTTTGGGAWPLCFSLVLPSGVDFVSVANLSDTSTVVFDTTMP